MKKLKILDFNKSYNKKDLDDMKPSDFIIIVNIIESYFSDSLNKNEKKLIKKRKKLLNYNSNILLREFLYSKGKRCNGLIIGLLFSEKKIKLCSNVSNIENKLLERMPINMKNTFYEILFRNIPVL